MTVDLGRMWGDIAPDPACLDLDASGPDAFFVLAVKGGDEYVVTAEAVAGGEDPALWVLPRCDGGCEQGSDVGGALERLSVAVWTDGDLLVVLDTRAGSARGEVRLAVERVVPVGPGDAAGGDAAADAQRAARCLDSELAAA